MQLTGLLSEGQDPKEAEATILAVPGVLQFTLVFPDKTKGRLARMVVIRVNESTNVLVLLQQTNLFAYIESSKPRFTCS